MNHQNQRENEDWLVLSDLSMGGFIIFLIIAVAFIARANRNEQGILNALKKFQSSKVEVDTTDRIGTIRFASTNTKLFETGKHELTKEFQQNLNDFLPEYLDTIEIYKDKIAEIRIEGHTDNTCADKSTCYETNLVLSSQRAYMVVEYILRSETLKKRPTETREALMRLFVASGHSYSQPLDAKGTIIKQSANISKIHADRSRRVDFRIILRAN